jgi:hypothetical protein
MVREMVDKSWVDHPSSDTITLPVAVANPASWRALVAAGFTQVGPGMLDRTIPSTTVGTTCSERNGPSRALLIVTAMK